MTDPQERRYKIRRREDRRRSRPFIVLMIVSFLVLAAAFHDIEKVRDLSNSNRTLIKNQGRDETKLKRVIQLQTTEGATHRKQIAASDLQLCTKLYGQIVRLEKDSAATTTVAIYHHLLPSVPLTDIRNLVKSAQSGALRVEAQFNPKQCRMLPSQKITKAKP